MFFETDMESSDTQPSDSIKQSKMKVDERGIERQLTQELSQNTFQRMVDNVFQDSPIMSQGTFNAVVSDLKTTPGLGGLYDDLCTSGRNENEKNDTGFFQFSQPMETDQQVGQKKTEKTRTPRIMDSPTEPIVNAFDMNVNGVIYYDTKDSALLNQSIVSNTTYSQITCGSQPIDYLRVRTKEEQELRNSKRLEKKLSENERKEKREMEARRSMEVIPQQVEPMNYDIDMDNSFNKTDKPIKKDPWIKVTVNSNDASKISDFAFADTHEGRHLWTRIDCRIPIDVKWEVDSDDLNRELFLRIRFVSYSSPRDIDTAIHDPNADCAKCVRHTNRENRAPIDSFFYVVNTELNWYNDQTLADRGHSFVTKLEPGATRISFDIMFACQKYCMPIDEKRKLQCFAVFLEDENGNEIVFDKIEIVSVVAYPRRDWKGYCEKISDFAFSEGPSQRRPRKNKKKKNSLPANLKLLSPGMYEVNPPNAMFNVTNTPMMYIPKSASRKRAASEFSPLFDVASSSSKPAGYSMRLHGCGPQEMDFENEVMENAPSTSEKRFKPVYYPHKSLVLNEKEYDRVVEFLAESGKEQLSKLTPSSSFGSFSKSVIIKPSDGIDKFLGLLGEQREVERFRRLGVHKMSDLTRHYEDGSDVFERLGVDFSKLEKYYDTFLHYYRIQENNKMFQQEEMI